MQFFKKYLTAIFIGWNSGIVYALLVGNVSMFLHDQGVSYSMIGAFSIVTCPYSFKYLWGPFVDNLRLPYLRHYLGQRRSWILSAQVLLMFTIALLGVLDIDGVNLSFVFCCFLIIAFLGAVHDTALEAYRIELFHGNENGIGNALVIVGFRIGLILSGIVGLFVSQYLGWRYTFFITALFILPCIIMILFSEDKETIKSRDTEQRLGLRGMWNYHVINPIKSIMGIQNVGLILVVILFYKVSDAYLDVMLLPFLKDHGYTKGMIAGVMRTSSIVMTLVGTFTGAFFLRKAHNLTLLFIAELLAALTNLLFIIICYHSGDIKILLVISALEAFCYGISNITFITCISALCDLRYTATHYAILISISGVSRSLLGMTSGYVMQNFGDVNFFVISAMLSIPSLMCIVLLKRKTRNISL